MYLACRLLFVALICISTKLLAQPYSIRIGTDSAFAGETVNLPIILSDPEAVFAQGARILRVKYLYNSTVLENLAGDPGTTLIRAVGIGDIGITLKNTPDTVIGMLHFRAGLGNAPSSVIHIDSTSTDSPNALLSPTDGLFALRGVCYEGGPRLMNPTGEASISVPTPVASEMIFTVGITLIEEGHTKLYLSDMLGRTSKEFVNTLLSPGSRSIPLDLSGVANGNYLLILETPTKQLSRTIKVAR